MQLMEALQLVSLAFTPDEAVIDAFQGVNLGVWVPPAAREGGPHDSGAYLTHAQCHRKGQRCEWRYGSAGRAYRQRCRQSKPIYQGQRRQN
jgi:hypothetical protein